MSSVNSTPSTMMRPASCRSSRFIVLSSVDLPEPEGPMMTTTSPSAMETSTSFSAVKFPNRLTTFSHADYLISNLMFHLSVLLRHRLLPGAHPQPGLRHSSKPGQRVGDHPVDQPDHDVYLKECALRYVGLSSQNLLRLVQSVNQGDGGQ